MRLGGRRLDAIELSPVRYEFPSMTTGNGWDLNWLIIKGDVQTSDCAWTFEDPCLTVSEARELGSWLLSVTDRHVAPIAADENDEIWPTIGFTEPNLGLSVEAQEAGDVILRVHLALESAPKAPSIQARIDAWQYWVRCWMSVDELRAAAAAWLHEVAAFPERGVES